MKNNQTLHAFVLSLVALLGLSFASPSFGAVNAYLEIKPNDGKVIKVPVADDGSFSSPSLKAGTYTFSWHLATAPTGSLAKFFGVSSPNGSSADRESSAPSVSEIVVSYEIKAPRDISTGLATGKRMHKPLMITKTLDRSTPNLLTACGNIVCDVDCDGITGMVTFKDKSGNTVRPTYDIKSNTR